MFRATAWLAVGILGAAGCGAAIDPAPSSRAAAVTTADADTPADLQHVKDFMLTNIGPPSRYTHQTLIVAMAAGTGNKIGPGDIDSAGRWRGGSAGFQVGHIAIAALLKAGWTPCQINDHSLVRFVMWGFGDAFGTGYTYVGPDDTGVDIFVQSLGGKNHAADGAFTLSGLHYTSDSLEEDAKSFFEQIDDFSRILGATELNPLPVLVVGHSWGAAYADYMMDRFYLDAGYDTNDNFVGVTPAFRVVAGVTAAANSQSALSVLAMQCPRYLDVDPSGQACNVRNCLTRVGDPSVRQTGASASGNLRTCVLTHQNRPLTVPLYSFQRPDDPIPPANLTTTGISALQEIFKNYPGIRGHDYIIRKNGSFGLSNWRDAANCARRTTPATFASAIGTVFFKGVFGIDTVDLSCQIGYGTNAYYPGSCTDSTVQSFYRQLADSSCHAIANLQDTVCVHNALLKTDGTAVTGTGMSCFVTNTVDTRFNPAQRLVPPGAVNLNMPNTGFLTCWAAPEILPGKCSGACSPLPPPGCNFPCTGEGACVGDFVCRNGCLSDTWCAAVPAVTGAPDFSPCAQDSDCAHRVCGCNGGSVLECLPNATQYSRTCVTLRGNGVACSADNQCQSNWCACQGGYVGSSTCQPSGTPKLCGGADFTHCAQDSDCSSRVCGCNGGSVLECLPNATQYSRACAAPCSPCGTVAPGSCYNGEQCVSQNGQYCLVLNYCTTTSGCGGGYCPTYHDWNSCTGYTQTHDCANQFQAWAGNGYPMSGWPLDQLLSCYCAACYNSGAPASCAGLGYPPTPAPPPPPPPPPPSGTCSNGQCPGAGNFSQCQSVVFAGACQAQYQAWVAVCQANNNNCTGPELTASQQCQCHNCWNYGDSPALCATMH